MRTQYIIAYDIADPARLRKVHRTVRDFGDAVQYSVFVCVLSKKDLAMLIARLREAMKLEQDQVLFVELGVADQRSEWTERITTLGKPLAGPSSHVIIV